jgi:hypothetical protein
MHHRQSTQDSEAKAAARFALQQAYDWRDEHAPESRDADEVLRGFETAVPYRACPATPKSAAATSTIS